MTDVNRRLRGDGAVSFLVVVPVVIVTFWVLLQIAVTSIAGSSAQHVASSMAIRVADARDDFASSTSGTAVCSPLDNLDDRAAAFVEDYTITVEGDGVAGVMAGAPCRADVTTVDRTGRSCQSALNGVEVVVEIEASAVLPDGGGIGIAALDRLRTTAAASCAPARSTP